MLSNNLLDYSVVKEPAGKPPVADSTSGGYPTVAIAARAVDHRLLVQSGRFHRNRDAAPWQVENTGLEPVTSGLQSRRSPN